MSIGNQMQKQLPSLTTHRQLRAYPPCEDHPARGLFPCHCPGVCCPQELTDVCLHSLAVPTFSPYWTKHTRAHTRQTSESIPRAACGRDSCALLRVSDCVLAMFVPQGKHFTGTMKTLLFPTTQNYWAMEMSYSPTCLNSNLLCYVI